MNNEQEPAALTAREAAALLGVNERTIRRAADRGELPATKCGRAYRITPADHDRFAFRRSGARRQTRRDPGTPRPTSMVDLPAGPPAPRRRSRFH